MPQLPLHQILQCAGTKEHIFILGLLGNMLAHSHSPFPLLPSPLLSLFFNILTDTERLVYWASLGLNQLPMCHQQLKAVFETRDAHALQQLLRRKKLWLSENDVHAALARSCYVRPYLHNPFSHKF